MTSTLRLGLLGFVLSVNPAWAGDFNPDVDFVTRASVGNLFAITESQLELDRTGDPRLKAFAQRLVEDHRQAQAALRAAADGSGATVPPTLDQGHQARLLALQGKSGADVDKAYLADQGEDHSNALTLYGDYMLLGDNEKLKAMAIKLIPITEAQLKTDQALAGD